MTNIELRNKLVELLPEYTFNEVKSDTDCIFGVKKLEHKTFRDDKKNLIKSENRIIFVSSEMYPNTDKNFRYALNYTKSSIRHYHCRTWGEHEYKKVFVSGKTNNEIINKIIDKFY